MPNLFSSFQLKDVTLRNRIGVSPMCQYSSVDGVPNDWHRVHLGTLAVGGSGLVVVEASAVSPEGRISPQDSGIWNDEQATAFEPITKFVESVGAVPGIQIAHAGRKASAYRPWDGDSHIPETEPEAWEIIGPSANAFGGILNRVPKAMSVADIARVTQNFVDAAKRSLDAGFKWLELHFAHGYLAQSFFSPLANKRTDQYGGSFENRSRFLLETLEAVRKVWPERFPLTARLGVIDFVDGQQSLEESIELIRQMKSRGLDLIDVSMGFNTTDVSGVPWGEHGFMVPIASRVRREVGIATTTSWNISNPVLTNKYIEDEQLDLVFIGRALLDNSHWPYEAAKVLGIEKPSSILPAPYATWLAKWHPPKN